MRTDVAIVGGGLSGLYAVRLLLDAGIEFQLLEARNRFSGRILSVNDKGDPSPDGFKLGPSWFWPGMHPRMAHVVEGLGLRAFPQHTDGDVVVERSRFEAVQRFPALPQEPPSMRAVRTVSLVLVPRRLRLTTHVYGSILARLRSCCSSLASETGVASGLRLV